MMIINGMLKIIILFLLWSLLEIISNSYFELVTYIMKMESLILSNN